MSIQVSDKIVREPIFTRQEQGVVYLFSRYWDKIDLFRGKRICNIHTHFPDFSIEDVESGAEEAVEFEYGLSDFSSHLYGDLKRLNNDGIRLLYIVYWDEDTDRAEVLKRIRKGYRHACTRFSGKVVFVCLSQYFSPCVEPGLDSLDASWVFSPKKQIVQAYGFDQIEQDTQSLMDDHALEPLKVQKDLYRIIGFNKSNSAFIECDHWKCIHLFTTDTPIAEHSIPRKLFVKPTKYQTFSGYFHIKYAYLINTGPQSVKDYFRNYYFYPYCSGYKESTCFVYSAFKEFTYDQGAELFEYLDSRYTLGVRGSPVIDDREHIRAIDRIVG